MKADCAENLKSKRTTSKMSNINLNVKIVSGRPQRVVSNQAAARLQESIKKKPLDLLVVGQQLTMVKRSPVAIKSKVMVNGKSKTVQRTKRTPLYAEQHNVQFVDDGEYVYVYESYPFPLWSRTEDDMQRDSPPQHLSLIEQVLDTRFFAELFDELLIPDR